jgi:potassium efflux system protein
MSASRSALSLLLLLWFASLTPALCADRAQESQIYDDMPTLSQVELAKVSLENDQTLDDSQKAKALEMYDHAANWLQLTEQTHQERSQLEETVSNAPQLIAKLQDEEASSEESSQLSDFISAADLPSLELRISEDELSLTQAREAQKRQLESLAKLLVGSKQINEQIDEHSKTLVQIQSEISSLPVSEPESLTEARLTSLKSRYLLRQEELELLKYKLSNLSLLTQLTQVQRDSTANRISRLQTDLEQLHNAAAELRESQASEAQEVAEQLQEQSADLPEPLRLIAEENARNRAELVGLVTREKLVSQRLATAKQQLDDIRTDFASTRQRVEVVGTSEAIGSMLYRRREALPSLRSYSRNSAERKAEINQATDRQITIEELLRERGNLQQVTTNILQSLPEAPERIRSTELRTLTKNLVQSRRNALNELQKVYSRHIAALTSLDLAERQLVEVSESYITYINDQLIWISSGKLSNLQTLGVSLAWLLQDSNWTQLIKDNLAAFTHRPTFAFIVALLVIVLIRLSKDAAVQLPKLANSVRKIRSDSFPLTLWALLYSLVKIALLPLLMIGLGIQLKMLPTAAPFTVAFAEALVTVGITLIAALLLYEVCRPEGVGPLHLRWDTRICAPLNRELAWLIPTDASIRLVATLSGGANLPGEALIVGRLSVIALLIVGLIFLYRLLQRQSDLMINWVRSKPHSLLVQLQFLWFPLLLLISIGLVISTTLGYQTLALRMMEHMEVTFWFFVGRSSSKSCCCVTCSWPNADCVMRTPCANVMSCAPNANMNNTQPRTNPRPSRWRSPRSISTLSVNRPNGW